MDEGDSVQCRGRAKLCGRARWLMAFASLIVGNATVGNTPRAYGSHGDLAAEIRELGCGAQHRECAEPEAGSRLGHQMRLAGGGITVGSGSGIEMIESSSKKMNDSAASEEDGLTVSPPAGTPVPAIAHPEQTREGITVSPPDGAVVR